MPLVNKFDDRLKDYVDVKERIRLFYERHPDGRLVTTKVKVTSKPDGVPRVWVAAAAFRTPDDTLPGEGWSWMVLPGSSSFTRGSEIENTETSAWGRAIGALGIGIEKSIASANEVANKAEDERQEEPQDGSLIGTVAKGKPPVDLELRETPEGPITGFKLTQGRGGLQVVAAGSLATTLYPLLAGLEGKRVTVWGTVVMVPWSKDGKDMPPYRRLKLERIDAGDWTLPTLEAETVPLFPEEATT